MVENTKEWVVRVNYTEMDLYELFRKFFPKVLNKKPVPGEIRLKVSLDLDEYKRDNKIKEMDISGIKYIPPACYAPLSKEIVFCLPLINEALKKFSKPMSEIFIKYLIVHESLHATPHIEDDREIYKIMGLYYPITYHLGDYIQYSGLLNKGFINYVKYKILRNYFEFIGKVKRL